jgi:ABC-type Fe3+ transport system permease subunit
MELLFLIFVLGCILVVPGFIAGCFEQIPARHRSIDEPWMSWLILVPVFAFYWNFRVFGGLSDSYQRAFQERGDLTVGDCGKQQAMVISVGAILCVIPVVNFLAIPAVGYGVIAWLWKMNQLKQQYGGSNTTGGQWQAELPAQSALPSPARPSLLQSIAAAREEIQGNHSASAASRPSKASSGGCGCIASIIVILIILFLAYSAWKIVDVRREGNEYYQQRQYNNRPSWSR